MAMTTVASDGATHDEIRRRLRTGVADLVMRLGLGDLLSVERTCGRPG